MRSRRHLLCFAFLALWLAVPQPQAQRRGAVAAVSVDRFQSAIDAARAASAQVVNAPGGPPGLGVAVLVDGRIVWAEGFGLADLEQRLPVWPSTKMRIGSVSKAITSAALGLLYEQGKLDLDAPVQKYVPAFPQKQYPITTRQVAGHLAGIRHYEGHVEAEVYNTRHYKTVLEALSIFQDDPLLFKPGEQFHYSSHGWSLLSAVVEGASGQDYLGYMQEHVFDPLGMRGTAADVNDRIILNRSHFYVREKDGPWQNAPYVDNSYKWAAGGLLSTPEDLVRFGWAIINGQLLRPETVRLFTTSLRTSDGKETGYGLGWGLARDDQGRRWIGHGGSSVGGASRLMIFPDERVAVAIIINAEDMPDNVQFVQDLASRFMPKR